jgi:hypothetical protein
MNLKWNGILAILSAIKYLTNLFVGRTSSGKQKAAIDANLHENPLMGWVMNGSEHIDSPGLELSKTNTELTMNHFNPGITASAKNNSKYQSRNIIASKAHCRMISVALSQAFSTMETWPLYRSLQFRQRDCHCR